MTGRKLFDPETRVLYEVVFDGWMLNYGMVGGELHVRVVRNAAPSSADLLLSAEPKACAIGHCKHARDPLATDGRRMGDIQFGRCIELVAA